MAIDLTGITNENEFYTSHYIAAILESDLKEVFSEWERREREEGIPAPERQLRRLSRDYFAFRSRFEKERAPAGRLSLQRDFFAQLLPALGYEINCALRELDDGSFVPLLSEVRKQSGAPEMWIVDVLGDDPEASDPLEMSLAACQYQQGRSSERAMLHLSLEDMVTKLVFSRAEPPRWVMLLSESQAVLLDRGKWNEKRILRFDMSEIFGRREHTTLQAMAALLHRDSICPGDGLSLLDTLDESSHRHAFAVSEDLKYALRESIERIANEAVWYMEEKLHEKIYGRQLSGQLTTECLRYMYRLLFLFYIEARPELGYAPMKSAAFRSGYSIESLRQLELVNLTSEESKNGYYIHNTITKLFELVYNGFAPQEREELRLHGDSYFNTFTMAQLRSHLFDPERTPLLNRVRLRNSVLRRVIELMSLSRPKGRKDRRGRISYAQLGINQLGAVYEALLSYQGFFAEEDLYEVKKSGEPHDELNTAYFVKAGSIGDYTEEERIYNDDGSLKMYPKGSFIYRLAGRDREKSASYYTPEALTRCLVKYALKELLAGKSADEILHLTICEPAMGSAAFLNEAVNQLAEAYLDRKQKETGTAIRQDQYSREKQKVKMLIADQNVFGVDLNPVAVELAEVSLWLNSIYEGAYVPWFGMQLVSGNSLVGARRQVFPSESLGRVTGKLSSFLDLVPERIMPGDEKPGHTVYHFLLPDRGMADYKDKVVDRIAAGEMKKIKQWRRDFTRPFIAREIERLEALTGAVDTLWEKHTSEQRKIRERTTDYLHVFEMPGPVGEPNPTPTEWKDKVYEQELLSINIRNSSPFRRLRLVMDYWCALWFWPIEKAELLPTREEFLLDLTLILEGSVIEEEPEGQLLLFPETRPAAEHLELVDQYGLVDVEHLCREIPRLTLVKELSERYRFHHWELEFSDIFADRGGFDLVLGNPPWIKVEWNEGGVMGDAEPMFVLRSGYSASKLAEMRNEVMEKYGLRSAYLSAFEEAEGTQNFLNALQNYPTLKGMQTNLYKCFLPQAWMVGKKDGVAAFLHPEGVYDDPKGGKFREEIYGKLRCHFQFMNAKKLFSEIMPWITYSINIYGRVTKTPHFYNISSVFHPRTIDECLLHSGYGTVPNMKDDYDNWDIRGHLDRILSVGKDELALFAELYDETATPPLQARLPNCYSKQILELLKRFASYPRRLGDIKEEFYSTQYWNETSSQKDGIIRRETRFPESPSEWILSGPHFYVGNPIYQTPKSTCENHRAYDIIDHTAISDNYLPRTNFIPACDRADYERRSPKVPWDRSPVTESYRLFLRRRISQSGERTLIAAIMPRGVSHIDACFSITTKGTITILRLYPLLLSLPMDFFIKTTGKGDIRNEIALILPVMSIDEHKSGSNLTEVLISRSLLLTCLTTHYVDLWLECFNSAFTHDRWAKDDPRLDNNRFSRLSPTWDWTVPLRTDYERRQALVEIDVLAAMAMGITLDELKTIYRIQFPVLRQNEKDTWYDRNGRIVFTVTQRLAGVGFSRSEWNEIRDMQSGSVSRTITDDTMPGGPRDRTIVYEAPFDCCDREKDYETAWAHFQSRMKVKV